MKIHRLYHHWNFEGSEPTMLRKMKHPIELELLPVGLEHDLNNITGKSGVLLAKRRAEI
jgi:hypothetical protein